MIQIPKGTKDILPNEISNWLKVEKTMREVATLYGYGEIRTPIFEIYDLFQRSVGDTTDIVKKEMYTFQDKGGEVYALRPELTVSVARAALENGLLSRQGGITRLFYNVSPVFRYEKPQLGRQRQFNQIGAEIFGIDSALADAEIILMATDVLKRLEIKEYTIQINTLGSTESRTKWRKSLVNYFEKNWDNLSVYNRNRLKTNPLRILDSKIAEEQSLLQEAPSIDNSLSYQEKQRFEGVQKIMTERGITFEINPRLVRGLDYYTDFIFEITSNKLGAQNAILGGGRYNNLFLELAEFQCPAIGFAAGVERLLLAMPQKTVNQAPTYYIASQAKDTFKTVLQLASNWRSKGVSVAYDIQEKSFKAQMRESNRLGARYTVILGDEEMKQGNFKFKNMQNGTESVEEIARYL